MSWESMKTYAYKRERRPRGFVPAPSIFGGAHATASQQAKDGGIKQY